jgi:adenylate kinase
MIGGPGVGKGTQGKILAKRLGIPHISAGELLRQRAAVNDDRGRRIDRLQKKRRLVPNRYVCELLAQELKRLGKPKRFILDGSPRSSSQAKILERFLPTCGIRNVHALYLEASDATLIARQKKRAAEDAAAGKPPRGDEHAIEQGIEVFHEQTRPMLAHFEKRGALTVVRVDDGSIAHNAALVASALGLTPLPRLPRL